MEKYLALKASAGSGKTFALTVRYISLLLFNVPPQEILTLTFTNKAVVQIKQKIYNAILTLGNDKYILEAISKNTDLTIKEILSKKNYIKQQFLTSNLSIFTIDKFINKILREFNEYVNFSDDFCIENNDNELLIYKFLLSLDIDKFNNLVNFLYIQNKKINFIISLFKILNKENKDLNNFVKSIKYDNDLEDKLMILANTIKEFILKQDLSSKAYNSVDFININELLKKGGTWLKKDNLGDYIFFKKAQIPTDINDKFQKLKEKLTLYFKQKENVVLKNIFDIFNDFKKFKNNFNRNKNVLNFEDVTNMVYNLLQNYIQKDFIYFRMDSYYSNILIDEFQDTSILQFKILQPLIQEIVSGNNNEKLKTFFYVGDTKQSIYRFRGGKKELFDYITNKFKQIKIQVLDTNYRSSENIVNFVNKNFNNLTNYEYYPQKINSTIKGYVEVLNFDIENPYEQISSKIQELIKNGINPNNIAILTYTNDNILDLYLHLKQNFPTLNITTEMTAKLILEPNIQAVINIIKYLYFKEEIYLANFNAIVGNKYDLPFKLKKHINIKNVELISLIKNISYEFNLLNQNMLKFIEIINNKYDSIVDFVYEIDKLDKYQIDKDNSGIQILTIFKSKGLEFDTVLVLDRIKQKQKDTNPLLFEYQDISLINIFYKQLHKEAFDTQYNNALNKNNILIKEDELNILYVALTRAKNNLIIFKKDKLSVFDSLDKCDIQTIGKLYTKQSAINKNIELEKICYKPLNLGLQDKKIQQDIENKSNNKAKYFGIATHYCLEIMGNFTKKALNLAIKITKNKYANILDDSDFDDIYNRILKLIKNKTFKNIINNSKILKEQSLTFKKQIKIIDLLLKKNNYYIICDYKTTTNSKDEHISQIKQYQKAISNITNMTTKSYLIYLQKNKTEIIQCK